jgi:hypothetical protein
MTVKNYNETDLVMFAYDGEQTTDINEAVHITAKTRKGLEILDNLDERFHDLPLDEAWGQKKKDNHVILFLLWTGEYYGIWAVLTEKVEP